MMSLPDGNSGKALAVPIGGLMLGTIYFAAFAPLFSYYEFTAQRLQDRQQLARRYQNLAGDLPRLRAAAAQRLGQSPDGDLLLVGSTDAVAAAMLQSALKELVEREGAKLTSAEMLSPETKPDTEDQTVRRVGVRIAFSGNLRVLTSVLDGIETTRPVLSVGSLNIHSAEGSKAENADRALEVVMDVSGFLPR